MTVVWHLDDLNISHKNGDTVDSLIRKISERYGKEADLTIQRGKVHGYLGMKLYYGKQGKVEIDMKDYLKRILDDLTDKYQGRDITTETNHLFEVNDTVRKLSEKDAQAFHTIVAKISLPMQASAAGYTDWGGFHHDASERARRRQRQEIVAHTEIYQR